jgi:HEPN domain-containing protein
VTNRSLAESYLTKAEKRLKALAVLRAEEAFSDVVREAQEIVELSLKGTLRAIGVEPPKHHDVGSLLLEHAAKFDPDVQTQLGRASDISKRLRKERELSFYGDIDFVPTEEYTTADADAAFGDAEWIVALARRVIAALSG